MSLTTRLSAFSLAALAAVLVGFSLALYGLAYVHLHRQDQERMNAALDTLAAAAEIHPDGVEWEPNERRIRISGDGNTVRWAVTTEEGKILDRSSLLTEAAVENLYNKTETDKWRIDKRYLAPNWEDAMRSGAKTDPDAANKHPFVVLTVGVSRQPTNTALRQLVAALTWVSSIIWLFAFLACHRFYRGALWPVRQMGAQADKMTAQGRRLKSTARRTRGAGYFQPSARPAGRKPRAAAAVHRRCIAAHCAGRRSARSKSACAPAVADEYRDVLARVEQQGQIFVRLSMLLFLSQADADAGDRLEPVDLADAGLFAALVDHDALADLR